MHLPQRIGFLGQGWSPDPGGIETFSAAIAKGLQEAGCAVSALALTDQEARKGISDLSGVRVTRARRPRPTCLAEVDDPKGLEQNLLSWLRRERPELVFVQHLSGWGLAALEVLAQRRVPFIVMLHDDWLLCLRGQRFHVEGYVCARPEPDECARCLARSHGLLAAEAEGLSARLNRAARLLRRASLVLAPSPAIVEAHRRGGIDAPIEVLELGVEAAVLAARTQALRQTPMGPLRLGVLGAVQPAKGVVFLAEALLATGREDLVLEVHGPRRATHGDASCVQRLEELARRSDRIRLHPAFHPHDLASVLAALDGLAMPSLWEEGFGLLAREARAASLPVLASATGGLLLMEQDPGTRLLPVGDQAAWTEALRRFERGLIKGSVRETGSMVEDFLRLLRQGPISVAA